MWRRGITLAGGQWRPEVGRRRIEINTNTVTTTSSCRSIWNRTTEQQHKPPTIPFFFSYSSLHSNHLHHPVRYLSSSSSPNDHDDTESIETLPFDLHHNHDTNGIDSHDSEIVTPTATLVKHQTQQPQPQEPKPQVEEVVVVEQKEENEMYVIDVDKLNTTLSFLHSTLPPSIPIPSASLPDAPFRSALDAFDLDLHPHFILKLLQSPSFPPPTTLLSFFTWALSKPRFRLTSPAPMHALVQAFSISDLRRNHVYALWDFVKDVGSKHPTAVDPPILNTLISLFCKLGKGKAALEVFDMFPQFGCVPDSDTYYYTLEALCIRSFSNWSRLVSDKMIEAGDLPDSDKVGDIISWFCKGDMVAEAYSIYLLAKEKNKSPPQAVLNLLVASICRKDETVKLSVSILDDFSGEARNYAIKPFSLVLNGLCRIKDVDGAKQLLSKMCIQGPPPGNAIFNSVISCYAKGGDMKQAVETMRLMESRGLKPDVYTYTVIMSAYVSGGEMEKASKMLSEAKKKHSKLGPVTYHTLIRGYCKLQQFDKALELLREMKKFGVKPNVDEYNKLIQSLCLNALDWKKAEKLLTEMTADGLHLNGITKGLVRAVKELQQEGVTV